MWTQQNFIAYKVRYTLRTCNFTVIWYISDVGVVILYVIKISVIKSFVNKNGLDAPQDCDDLAKSQFSAGTNARLIRSLISCEISPLNFYIEELCYMLNQRKWARIKQLACLKLKQFRYRPGQTMMVPGDWGSQTSRQSAHEGGKVVCPTHWPSLPTKKYSWYSIPSETESTSGPQCDRKMILIKIAVTPSGIEHTPLRPLLAPHTSNC